MTAVGALLLTGCERTLTKGTPVVNNKKLYAFTMTDEGYAVEETAGGYGCRLLPTGALEFVRGNYLIHVFQGHELPQEVRGNLPRALEWINRTAIQPSAGRPAEVLHTASRSVQGEPALYGELFLSTGSTLQVLPDQARRQLGRATISREGYGYVSVIFYHRGNLFWVMCSDPAETARTVSPDTRRRFEEFLRYFVVDPQLKHA